MMKKRKDSGFTLIELMIVIAVIGILAIVLVPKVGTIKTQSKTTGLDTNIRLVQGYAESKIDKWVSKNVAVSDVVDDIRLAFTSADTSKQLVNPFTSTSINAAEGTSTVATGPYSVYVLDTASTTGDSIADTDLAGSILVVIKDATAGVPIEGIYIYAYDQAGAVITEKNVIVTP